MAEQLEVVYDNHLRPPLEEYEERLRLFGTPARRGVISLLRQLPVSVLKSFINPGDLLTTAIIPVLAAGSAVTSTEGRPSVAYLAEVKESLTPRGVIESLARRATRATAGALSDLGQSAAP